ncbi:efflux RND transporter periplasmic adaptor subunit [bacterium]|nr:efflux RND transporter periplasmic adaptor subunit [bacterium]
MKKVIFILLTLIVAIPVGYKIWQKRRPDIPLVKTIEVKRGKIVCDLTDVGRVTSSASTTIRPEVGGTIKEVLVDEGDRVKQGEELSRLDLREIKNSLSQAENKLNQARLELEGAKRELNRTRELYEAKAASRLKLDTDRTRYDHALIQVSLAKEELSLTKIKLSKLKVISSQSGVVVSKKVEDGQVVQPGEELFVVADLTNLEVEVDIDEVDVPSLRVGQPVMVTSEGLPGHQFKGEIIKIAPQARVKENTTVVKTTVRLYSSKGLKMGNQVDVRIVTDQKTDCIILPLEALVEEEDRKFIFLYSNGVARKREVTTGISSLEEIEIVSGLKEMDKVIIPQGIELKDQDRVRKE